MEFRELSFRAATIIAQMLNSPPLAKTGGDLTRPHRFLRRTQVDRLEFFVGAARVPARELIGFLPLSPEAAKTDREIATGSAVICQ